VAGAASPGDGESARSIDELPEEPQDPFLFGLRLGFGLGLGLRLRLGLRFRLGLRVKGKG
jgi:hypothetical protein